MAEVSHYDVGDTAERILTFKVNGVPTDPAAVTAKVRDPVTGIPADYAYPSANLVRDSAGIYRLLWVITAPGRWYYRAVGTGAAAAVEEDYVIGDPSLFDLLTEVDAYALTTIEDAELYLDRVGIQGTKASEADELRFIAGLINAKSWAIHRYLRRQLKPVEDGATKKFRYDGRGVLHLAPYELRSVTSVQIYTDLAAGSWLTLEPQTASREADYTLEPRPKTVLGTYLRVNLPELARDSARTRRHGFEVSIAGNWGAGIVPADVKAVCEAEVKAEWERSKTRRRTDPDGEQPQLAPFDLSHNSRKTLNRYRVKRPRTRTLEIRG